MSEIHDPDLTTIREAAAACGVHYGTIRNYVERGAIRYRKIGGSSSRRAALVLVSRSDALAATAHLRVAAEVRQRWAKGA